MRAEHNVEMGDPHSKVSRGERGSVCLESYSGSFHMQLPTAKAEAFPLGMRTRSPELGLGRGALAPGLRWHGTPLMLRLGVGSPPNVALGPRESGTRGGINWGWRDLRIGGWGAPRVCQASHGLPAQSGAGLSETRGRRTLKRDREGALMLNSAFSMDQAAYSSVSGLCEDFVRRSNATCALLVGQDGMLLHRCGSAADLDVDGLSALSAGAFASGREMARLIGETTFDVAIQQGRRNHLQLIRVGDRAILVAVFDDHTTAAMVRLYGQRVARQLARVLGEGEELEPATGREGEGGPSEFLGQTRTRAEQFRAALQMRTISFVLALLAAGVALLSTLLRR